MEQPEDSEAGQPIKAPDSPEFWARKTAEICANFKAEHIVVLDVREMTALTDIMVLATCASDRQMKGLAEELRVESKRAGNQPLSLEDSETSWWTLLDLNYVVVHLFTEEARRYYDLEVLWGDAPKFDWEAPPAEGEG